MTIINCLKLKKESEALDYEPYPGDVEIGRASCRERV